MRELILDTETTGLDPKDNHRIIELACVELVNLIPTGMQWHWYFNPERDVPRSATEIHGLTAAFLADKPIFCAVIDEILAVIDGARLVIHNAAFDVGFLNHEFGKLRRPSIQFDRVTDTLAIARRKHAGSPNSLDALCKRYAVDNTGRTKHGALLDCELLAAVYVRLMGAEQAGLNFASREDGDAFLARSVAQVRLRPVDFRLSEAERIVHRAFAAALGASAIWHFYDDAAAPGEGIETSAA